MNFANRCYSKQQHFILDKESKEVITFVVV